MKQKLIIFFGVVWLVLIGSLTLPTAPRNFKKATPTPSTSLRASPAPVVLIATGDVMLGRAINARSVQQNNFIWMWEKTAEILQTADLAFINLESPFVQDCPTTNTGMIFCADVRNLNGLTSAGIDIANLANNHFNNYGQAGIKTTIKLLNSAGIAPVGIGVPVYKNLKGIKFAFLGYNTFGLLPDIEQEIKQAKTQSDIVVVAFHWGEEYTGQPNPRQRELAYLAIDNGADLIVGHHPHWIQLTETYKNKLIVYSLGNFIFDQGWSEKTRQGLLGKFTFLDSKLINFEFLPIEISTLGQPNFLE